MSRIWIPALLVWVFGAVLAEAQTSSSYPISLSVERAAALGKPLALRVEAPLLKGSNPQATVFFSTSVGSTVMTMGTHTLALPLSGTVFTLGSAPVTGTVTYLSGIVPNDPSLVGYLGRAVAVVTVGQTTMMSALVPFGPIVEDSIN